MEEVIIKRITEVKYTGSIRPAESPFCDTINATSPRVIIPTPIFKQSAPRKRHAFAIRPQPIILQINATSTKQTEKDKIDRLKFEMSVFRPILAKNSGPKII